MVQCEQRTPPSVVLFHTPLARQIIPLRVNYLSFFCDDTEECISVMIGKIHDFSETLEVVTTALTLLTWRRVQCITQQRMF